jgi:predicted lipid carrier protein YhbT
VLASSSPAGSPSRRITVTLPSDVLVRFLSLSLSQDLESTIKGVIVFDIDDSGRWVLDLREGSGALTRQGDDVGDDDQPEPDLVLTMSGDTFVKLVSKKISSQQAFLMRKLKIKGSMGMAMKLQPVLDAAVETPSKL